MTTNNQQREGLVDIIECANEYGFATEEIEQAIALIKTDGSKDLKW